VKLTRRVKKLEAQFAGDAFGIAAAACSDIGITWTRRESPASELVPGPGERIVEDLVLDEPTGGARQGATIARITADPDDLGVVYNAQHRRIGRVTARKGGARIIEWG